MTRAAVLLGPCNSAGRNHMHKSLKPQFLSTRAAVHKPVRCNPPNRTVRCSPVLYGTGTRAVCPKQPHSMHWPILMAVSERFAHKAWSKTLTVAEPQVCTPTSGATSDAQRPR